MYHGRVKELVSGGTQHCHIILFLGERVELHKLHITVVLRNAPLSKLQIKII